MALPLQARLHVLLDSMPSDSVEADLSGWVVSIIKQSQPMASDSARKLNWELCLRSDILDLAAREGSMSNLTRENYYAQMRTKLDVILLMSERDACDNQFPLAIIEDLMDTQTIESCSFVFSWMEDRFVQLTQGMMPERGKALILLRTLNELLRRLSKTAQTTFCGRILTFLSRAYPLGDRSGVNLRGEYGPPWEGVTAETTESKSTRPESMEIDCSPQPGNDSNSGRMAIDETDTVNISGEAATPEHSQIDQKRRDFFQTFWSLQLSFSRPNYLTQPGVLQEFRNAVNTVLPVISEANKRERLMMGSKAVVGNANVKRKRETSMEHSDESKHDYFFAKFLTSPKLLDLEIADSLFRRQVLFQLLIILQHLRLMTKTERAKGNPPRNRSVVVDFALESQDTKWINETWNKVMTEIRATSPLGKEFAETVSVILERERNWISWKNESCPPFDQAAISPLEDETAEARTEMLRYPENWKWRYGTEALTELFELGYRNLQDLESPQKYDDFPGAVKQIKAQDKRIEMRKRQLEMQAQKRRDQAAKAVENSRSTTKEEFVQDKVAGTISSGSQAGTGEVARGRRAAQTSNTSDPQLLAFEMHKRKLSWLALRIARNEYWQLFSAAKGNPEKMMWMIERNKESMKKPDEESFGATGWIEGDTSIIQIEGKPSATAIDPASSISSSALVTPKSNELRRQTQPLLIEDSQLHETTEEQDGAGKELPKSQPIGASPNFAEAAPTNRDVLNLPPSPSQEPSQ